MILNLPVSVSSSISAKVTVRPGVTPTRGRLSLATPIKPGAGDHRHAILGDRVDVGRHLLAAVLAAEFDRLLRRLRIGDRLRRIGLRHDALVAEFVVAGCAAQHLRGDVEQLVLQIHRSDVVGARLGRCREAAGLRAVPRQSEPAVAALDDHVLPRDIQQVGRNARRCRMRVGAEIADAGVDVQLAVRA